MCRMVARDERRFYMATSTDFSFQLLHEFYPERAERLVEALKTANRIHGRMEDWRETQLRHFVEILIGSAFDLERGHAERKISSLAWLTRNLLELSVWVQYCNLSPENAKRFYDDAVRDMYGWSQAFHDLYIHQEGKENPQLAVKLVNLDKYASARGIAPLADDFTRVSAAAKTVGCDTMFAKSNKIYSKFAHPTAWVVATAASQQADKEFRELLFEDGVNFAVSSIILIRNEIVRVFPEIE
jgi:hypothetical protein